MKKVLFVVPHLSTGGLPQYTLKMIEEFIGNYDIHCIEYQDITGGILTVQRNKISNLLGDNFYSLSHDVLSINQIISKVNPDVIHFQEIPESFIPISDLEKIYESERRYKIVVTTHGSNTNPHDIVYGADKFILVSNWSKGKFIECYDESICDVWEYPINPVAYDKNSAKKELGFDSDYIHVLNVGLFTPGKNQKELIDIARKMKNQKIKFHFVGNQASNFKEYWQPIIKNFPNNCIWHGEREDVDLFYKAADIFYFTSNLELNPIVVKEALSYGLPTFIKKLEPYGNEYDGLVNYITGDIDDDIKTLQSFLSIKDEKTDVLTIILAHADTIYRKKLLRDCIHSIKGEKLLSCNYAVDVDVQKLCDHVLYTKDNPLLLSSDFQKYGLEYNYWWKDENGKKNIKSFDYEHGYAVYTLIQNALRYAKNLGKNKIHVINYDYVVDDITFKKHEKLMGEYDVVFYEHTDPAYDGVAYNSAFFSGDIDSIQSFFEKYKSLDEYYSDGSGFNILERKIENHYKNTSHKIYTQSVSILKKTNSVNREGMLDLSKSEKYENLSFQELCKMFECDKGIVHEYHKVYETVLSKYRDREINLFEIGLDGGNSLPVWENYLPLAKIYGMDISKKYKIKRGETFIGDQNNINDLSKIVKSIPKCDVIIDDGSHVSSHQIKSFQYLFQNLLDWGGVYIIEDIECSYWRPETTIYGYETGYLNIVDYFTKLNHSVNSDYSNNSNTLYISSVSYYANCIVITKKTKQELTNKQYRFQNYL